MQARSSVSSWPMLSAAPGSSTRRAPDGGLDARERDLLEMGGDITRGDRTSLGELADALALRTNSDRWTRPTSAPHDLLYNWPAKIEHRPSDSNVFFTGKRSVIVVHNTALFSYINLTHVNRAANAQFCQPIVKCTPYYYFKKNSSTTDGSIR